MINLFFPFILLLQFLTFAQKKETISTDWLENNQMSFGVSKNIPKFIGNCYFYDTEKKAIFYNLNISGLNSIDE